MTQESVDFITDVCPPRNKQLFLCITEKISNLFRLLPLSLLTRVMISAMMHEDREITITLITPIVAFICPCMNLPFGNQYFKPTYSNTSIIYNLDRQIKHW